MPLPHADYSLKTIDKHDLPRERLRRLGANALKTEELVALILRTGTRGENALHLAERLLRENGGLAGLAQMSVSRLERVKGLGKAKAVELHAALELGRGLIVTAPENRPVVKSPADAANPLVDMGTLEPDQMRLLLLDNKNRVLSISVIYTGSVNTTVSRVGELFKEEVRQNCTAIIIAHNHPSGDPNPSAEDTAVTGEIVKAGNILDIALLDHQDIGGGSDFVSLKERGLGLS